MAAKKKTWNERMHTGKKWQVKPAPMDIAGMKAGQIMLVPDGKLLASAIFNIPEGHSLGITKFRLELAKQHHAEVCCPITTGILLRIIAEAAFERYEAGDQLSDIPPIWRLLDEQAPTLKKLSYDPDFLLNLRKQEGIA